MRSKALLNVKYGVLSQMVKILLQFIVRKTFIYYLGVELLGVHSLFTSILSMLAMAELGIGSAVAFSLYKPIVQKDTNKISAIMCLYRKLYRIIGIIILTIGCLLLPFIPDLVSTTSEIPYLRMIFFIILLNTSLTYLLFAYSQTLLIAAECKYEVDKVMVLFNILTSIGETLIIITTHNFILYLLVEMVCLISQQFLIYKKAYRRYPEIMSARDVELCKGEKREIWKNVYGLSIGKVSGAMLGSIDSIILSVFISTTVVGLYSNYLLVQTAATTIISIVFTSVTANVGRKFADNTISQSHLYLMFFLNFIICGVCVVMYFALINDFITLFLGNNLLLPFQVVCAFSLNIFITYMSLSIQVFKDASGIFWHGKYRPLVTCVLNMLFSLLLVKPLGIAGVVFATALSRLVTTFWFDPYLVFKYAFNSGLKKYFVTYGYYTALVLVAVIILHIIFKTSFFDIVTIPLFICKAVMSFVVIFFTLFIGTMWMEPSRRCVSNLKRIICK